ncbi:MAG TPA: hypothetical protein ENK08_00565 [Chloroflexi bacterium]|nr:hypothetical protein [Chloroflexota bacterium]
MRSVDRLVRFSVMLLLLLAACAGPISPPTSPPPPTDTPPPTAPPTPTPIPPVVLTIRWPDHVSPLQDFPLEVEAVGLEERDPNARLSLQMFAPSGQLWWTSELHSRGDGTYTTPQAVHLPLQPEPGEWMVRIGVVSTAPVTGTRTLRFTPEPVRLRDMRMEARDGIVLPVPWAFVTLHAEGDDVAGARVWQGGGGEVGLWWTPGPVKPLDEDTARVLLEATFPEGVGVEVVGVEPVEWHGLLGFRFSEHWPQGPAETLVLQGSDFWLYALRIRATGGPPIPPLLWDIQAGFRVEESEP